MRYFLVLLILFQWQFATAEVIYEVSFPNPNTHYIHVTIHFRELPKDSFEVKMPVWIPGSYMVREFSRNVESFRAFDPKNKPVPFSKISKNTWRIYNDTATAMSVSYQVYAYELSVRTSFVDIDHAYINGTSVFMYTPTLMNAPALINFKPYKSWNNISTGLMPFGTSKWSRVAENYDELADCPVVIGNQDIFSFDFNGIPHHIVMIGSGTYNKDVLIKDFYKIAEECTRIFGENPLKEYYFIIHNISAGGGGLEHRNSCSVITNRHAYDKEKSYKSFLSLIAHEYFHLWAIKRLRPAELGPFNYDAENYSNQLWFFEGFTSYFDDYIIYKTGLYTEAEYLNIVKNNLQIVVNTPGDRIQSLAESSFDAWIKYYRQNENSRNATVSYYTKGGVLGAITDIDIIHSTGGTKTLADVFHYLYHEHFLKTGKGISDADLQNAFEVVAGKDYDAFFEQYIFGTEPVPYENYFELAGLKLVRTDGKRNQPGYLGATFTHSGSRLLVSYVERGSAAWEQGLYTHDEITGVDGKEPMQVRDYLAEKKPGDKVKFSIIRAGLEREFTIQLGESPNMEFEFEFIKKPTPEQEAVRRKWLPMGEKL